MNKKEKIKTIVSYIIRENPCIINAIKNSNNTHNQRFLVQINNDAQSLANKGGGQIILGLGDLPIMLEICDDFCKSCSIRSNLWNCNIHDYIECTDFTIDLWDLNEKDLFGVGCLNNDSFSSYVPLLINALAFTIYHEFGHIVYNEDYKLAIENERNADLYAMELLKEKCLTDYKNQIDCDPIFLGAFLDCILILVKSDFNYVEVSNSHPHPIERIYKLLEYFHLGDDSYLWKYAYERIVKWIHDNNKDMTFEKDSSITIKDKLIDAYLRFKK